MTGGSQNDKVVAILDPTCEWSGVTTGIMKIEHC